MFWRKAAGRAITIGTLSFILQLPYGWLSVLLMLVMGFIQRWLVNDMPLKDPAPPAAEKVE